MTTLYSAYIVEFGRLNHSIGALRGEEERPLLADFLSPITYRPSPIVSCAICPHRPSRFPCCDSPNSTNLPFPACRATTFSVNVELAVGVNRIPVDQPLSIFLNIVEGGGSHRLCDEKLVFWSPIVIDDCPAWAVTVSLEGMRC